MEHTASQIGRPHWDPIGRSKKVSISCRHTDALKPAPVLTSTYPYTQQLALIYKRPKNCLPAGSLLVTPLDWHQTIMLMSRPEEQTLFSFHRHHHLSCCPVSLSDIDTNSVVESNNGPMPEATTRPKPKATPCDGISGQLSAPLLTVPSSPFVCTLVRY